MNNDNTIDLSSLGNNSNITIFFIFRFKWRDSIL